MATEEETDGKEQGSENKKSSPLMLIILIVVLVLVILIGAIIFIVMMGGDEESATSPQQAPSAKERKADPQMASLLEVGPMFPLDAFTVNLLSESGRRYLKVEMNIELSGEELAPELENKKAVMRDVIIRLLSSKSLEEISTAKGKDKLKEQIVDQLNMRLRDGHINNVYFTEFVIQ